MEESDISRLDSLLDARLEVDQQTLAGAATTTSTTATTTATTTPTTTSTTATTSSALPSDTAASPATFGPIAPDTKHSSPDEVSRRRVELVDASDVGLEDGELADDCNDDNGVEGVTTAEVDDEPIGGEIAVASRRRTDKVICLLVTTLSNLLLKSSLANQFNFILVEFSVFPIILCVLHNLLIGFYRI